MTDEPIEYTDNVIPLFPEELPPVEDGQGLEMEEWVFTNDKTNPAIRQLYRMIHYSIFENKIGLMHCKVRGEDKVHTVIVGVENTPDGLVTWPLAKILTEEEQNEYLAPDGEGNYIGEDSANTSSGE